MTKDNIKTWTQSAIDCYKIGCRCSMCQLNEVMKDKCRMKHMVLELVRIHGKPKEEVLSDKRLGKWINF